MAETGLTVEGLDQVAAALVEIGNTDPGPALTEFGKAAATEAVRIAPKKTGALAAAISSTYYGGAGGVAIKVDTTRAPHGYTFHAVALGKSTGGFTFRVPAHSRGGYGVSGYTRQAYIPNRPFLFQAVTTKTKELTALLEAELTKKVTG